ncbi:hypothetical protein U9M48_034349 [Paspalum notatum var. saurae]|uniref:Association with the SNF1 complex (ASC) domain-containing protein n=1 Tax=Paspalum notatum var. saurae TaxID=547442 RepID=A0AAQ3X7E0_PASNO
MTFLPIAADLLLYHQQGGLAIPSRAASAPVQIAFFYMSVFYYSSREGVHVVGFEVPPSPDASYNNPIPGNEDEGREPPLVPPHLQHTLLSFPQSQDECPLPQPQTVVLNHLYIEKENTRSVVALGITHRFRAKFVTVVLYKPVLRR